MSDPAVFLHELAANDISERLTEINKSFTKVAIVTGCPKPWAKVFPNARIVADSEHLNFPDTDYDLIIHGLSLHSINDPVGQIIQCRMKLHPDGLFVASLFGGQTLTELRVVLAEAETKLRGGLSPRISPMAEVRELGNLLSRSGLALPVADSDLVPVTYADMASLMCDLRAMSETNIMAARQKTFTPRSVFDLAEELYQQHYSQNDGRINATFELITLTGWCPSDTQQKPLKPGSAKSSLEAALKAAVAETDATPPELDPKG